MSSEEEVDVPTALGLVLRAGASDFVTQVLREDRIFEPAETDLVTRLLRAGDVCLDVGCHVGYYTCLMARLVGPGGRVYAFDANPRSCALTRQSLALNSLQGEVVQAAVGNSRGTTPFNLSSEEQTGLSSLGEIPTRTEAIVVPWLLLEDFLKERRIKSARLLKIDVEGAEEMVLRGLGDLLEQHVVDYILLEAYDERLKLLNTSTEKVAGLLRSAGYLAWEFGTKALSGWTRTDQVVSRGDCNYLFSSPRAWEGMTQTSVVAALSVAMLRKEEIARLQHELGEEKQSTRNLQSDLSISLDELRSKERDIEELHTLVQAMRNSPGWRLFNRWRHARDRFLPEGTILRRGYEAMVRRLRGRDNQQG